MSDRFEQLLGALREHGIEGQPSSAQDVRGWLFHNLDPEQLEAVCASLGHRIPRPSDVPQRHQATSQVHLWVHDGCWRNGDAHAECMRLADAEQEANMAAFLRVYYAADETEVGAETG